MSSLPVDIPPKFYERDTKFLTYGSTTTLQYAAAEMKGARPTMEDRKLIASKNGLFIFGVFDGHGGDGAAEFMKCKLPDKIFNLANPFDQQQIITAVEELDAELLTTPYRCDGTCICFAIIAKEDDSISSYKVAIVNAGDSRAILVHQPYLIDIVFTTIDHKGYTETEKKRVETAGGYIGWQGRVDGTLAVSRAAGDYRYKDNDKLKLNEQKVIATPDVTIHKMNKGDILYIYCDGVYERMENKEIVSTIEEFTENYNKYHKQMTSNFKEDIPENQANILSCLLGKAQELQTSDNTTIITVHFGDFEVFENKTKYVYGNIPGYSNITNEIWLTPKKDTRDDKKNDWLSYVSTQPPSVIDHEMNRLFGACIEPDGHLVPIGITFHVEPDRHPVPTGIPLLVEPTHNSEEVVATILQKIDGKMGKLSKKPDIDDIDLR